MNTEKLTSEIISDLTVTMLITLESLIQIRKSVLRQAEELDREIKRIEDQIGKDTITKITEGR